MARFPYNRSSKWLHENLLAVIQILAGLRYNDPALLAILGGKEAMIESPVLQQFVAEQLAEHSRTMILGVLDARFGAVPANIPIALNAITDDDRLQQLNIVAARCTDLEAFRRQLLS